MEDEDIATNDEDASGNLLLLSSSSHAQLEHGVDGYEAKSAEDFIRHYSTINTTNHTNLPAAAFQAKPRGSRDPISLHRYQCFKTPGCKFSTLLHSSMDYHFNVCFDPASSNNTPKFECSVEDCTKIYRSQASLNQHVVNVHHYVPQHCQVAGCETGIFKNKRSLHNHNRQYHPPGADNADYSTCQVKNCNATIMPATRTDYIDHLKKAHKLMNSRSQTPKMPPPKSPAVPTNEGLAPPLSS